MKFKTFKDKLPVLGSNVLVMTGDGKAIGIVEFTLAVQRSIHKQGTDYHPQDYYADDPEEDGEYDIISANYWCYPSELSKLIPRA